MAGSLAAARQQQYLSPWASCGRLASPSPHHAGARRPRPGPRSRGAARRDALAGRRANSSPREAVMTCIRRASPPGTASRLRLSRHRGPHRPRWRGAAVQARGDRVPARCGGRGPLSHLRGDQGRPGVLLGRQWLRPARQRHDGWDRALAGPGRGRAPLYPGECERAHTCGVTKANGAYCWGFEDFGQLGNGAAGSTDAPSPVSPPAS
jgi:hypothetical protein